MPIVSIVDSETTGISQDSKIVEYAAIHLQIAEDSSDYSIVSTDTFLINPGVEIPPEASAVHHLTMDHLANAPSHAEAQVLIQASLSKSDYVAAHNAAFDSRFISTQLPWICTYRCAKHLLDVPSYGNQQLRYRLGLKPNLPDNLSAHRAMYDAAVTVELFIHLLNLAGSLEKLHQLTNTPILEKTITFGAHRGKKFSDVPTSYLKWLLNLTDKSPDFIYTVKYHLKNKAN